MANSEYLYDLAAWQSWQRRQLAGSSRRQAYLRRCLALVLEEMTPLQRQVFLLHYEQHMTCTQIARQLGCHKSSASRTLKRAQRKVQRALQYMNL